MVVSPQFTLQRLRVSDASSLAVFYNRLSKESKRTFRPIGPITIPEKCAEIAADNIGEGIPALKYDLIAVYEDKIIGWGFIWDLATSTPTLGLAVADAFHNQGVGTLLIKCLLDWALDHHLTEVHLTVVQDNAVAQKLYQKHGFVKTGEFIGDDGQPYFRMVTQLH